MGVRSPNPNLLDHPGHPMFFDNFAACPWCARGEPSIHARPLSERDGTVFYDPVSSGYRCNAGHVFSSETALWDVVQRG